MKSLLFSLPLCRKSAPGVLEYGCLAGIAASGNVGRTAAEAPAEVGSEPQAKL